MIIPAVTPQIPVALPTPVAVEPARRPDTENKSKQKDSQSDSHTRQDATSSADSPTAKPAPQQNAEEIAEIQQLAQRDREVRAHEAAHKGVAGQYATGAAQFSYTRGPDGRQYATGGEVGIDASVPGDPADAIRKAQIIRRAALAPAQPSGQDRAVAAQATQMEAQARADLLEEQAESRLADKTQGEQKRNEVNQAYTIDPEKSAQELDITA